MRRFFSMVLAAAAMVAFSAGPAAADNDKIGEGGPPILSGNENGAGVFHCNAIEGSSASVFTPNGDIRRLPLHPLARGLLQRY